LLTPGTPSPTAKRKRTRSPWVYGGRLDGDADNHRAANAARKTLDKLPFYGEPARLHEAGFGKIKDLVWFGALQKVLVILLQHFPSSN
jgi:hypothetical protein